MKKALEKLNGLRVWALSSPWIVVLLFLPFFRPNDIVNRYLVLSWAMVVYKGVAMLLIAACFFAKPKLSPVTVLIGVYQLLLAVCTWLDHSYTHYAGWVYSTVSIGALCILVEEAVETDPKALVRGAAGCLGLLCLVNLATVLLFPGGMRYMDDSPLYSGLDCFYFLGMDNSHSFFIVPLLPLALLCAWNRRWPFAAQAALLALFTASIYITWPASGVVAVSAFIALFVLYRVKNSWKLFNVCTCYGAVAAVFLLVVALRVTDWLQPVIVNVLHKSMTLSGRLPLWERVMPVLRAKPLLGYGMYEEGAMWQLVGQVNCHNLFLQTMFETGLAGLAVYAAALGLLVRPLMRTRRTLGGYMLTAGLFAFLLVLQAEALVWPLPFYTVMLLCYHAERVVAALAPPESGSLSGC